MPETSNATSSSVQGSSYQIQPPGEFDFTHPEQWSKWIQRFERFCSASGLKARDEETQVNTLLYSMGEKSEDIMTTFNLTGDNAKKYDSVKEKFDNYFIKRRNTIFERAKLNTRKQEVGESVDAFITDLYCLAKHCNYGLLHDETIRDRIVVGLLDSRLSEKLQIDPELTLEKAVNATRQSELVKKQQSVVRGTEGSGVPPKTVEAVHKVSRRKGPKQSKARPGSTQSSTPSPMKCNRCGLFPGHARTKCPAKEAKCLRCKKKKDITKPCVDLEKLM